MQKAIAVVLALAGMASGASALAGGGPSITLGVIPFPPGPEAVQVQITLQPNSDTVTATPLNPNPYMGAPRLFPYDSATGKGFELVQATAVPFQVVNENSPTPGVIFWQYVSTGNTYTPRAARAGRSGTIQGVVNVDGIWVLVTINQNVTPATVTVTQMGPRGSNPPLVSQIYPQSNMAPFAMNQYLYTVKLLAPGTGRGTPSFVIEKWMLYSDNTTNGIYTAGYPFPLP